MGACSNRYGVSRPLPQVALYRTRAGGGSRESDHADGSLTGSAGSAADHKICEGSNAMPETSELGMQEPKSRPSGRLNGSGAVNATWEAQDITLSYVPLLVAFTIAAAVAVGAFQIGKLFSRYEIERGEILSRLDSIEDKLSKALPAVYNKSLHKKRGEAID